MKFPFEVLMARYRHCGECMTPMTCLTKAPFILVLSVWPLSRLLRLPLPQFFRPRVKASVERCSLQPKPSRWQLWRETKVIPLRRRCKDWPDRRCPRPLANPKLRLNPRARILPSRPVCPSSSLGSLGCWVWGCKVDEFVCHSARRCAL